MKRGAHGKAMDFKPASTCCNAPPFHLTVPSMRYKLASGCAVKRLIVALLIVGTLASTVFAQTAEQIIKDRHKVFVGWLGIVKSAEAKYESKHGVYGNLTALRHAHLLDALVFESSAPSQSPPDSALIPASTDFQVTVSSDGQHYKVAIHERLVDVGNISLLADEVGTEWIVSHPPRLPLEDGPQGPMPSVAR
jgi:hypothetical protein